MKNEAFLPKKAFAGSDKHKLGPKGQARGEPGRSQKAPLTGLMVGEEIRAGDFVVYVDTKPVTHYQRLSDAKKDADFLRNKFPNKKISIKQHPDTIGESVIIGPDESGDWTNPQVQILGGGGSYTLDRLYKKAKGEAAEIKELIDAGEHKKAAFYLKQFKNTLDTIVAAKDELSKRHFGEAKQRLDPKCWKGYRKQGTKMKDGVRVNNCVKVGEDWDREISKLIKILESK